MTNVEFKQNLDDAYFIILERTEQKKSMMYEAGFYVDRVSFEEIDLTDIFETLLVPLIPECLKYYKNKQLHVKINKVYVATLCEMAKNGFAQGGILLTIDAHIGESFDRNRHYKLLSTALQQEGIEAIEKNGRTLYEETIINESGIPRKFHSVALRFFEIYWKWLKHIPVNERHTFLDSLIEETEQPGIYVHDQGDWTGLLKSLSEMKEFREKLKRTCLNLERVFTSIDAHPVQIDESNFETECAFISMAVGFNILTVIRAERIRRIILDYSHKISFSKFGKTVRNLPVSARILLPNGTVRAAEHYTPYDFLGGMHTVNGMRFEVSYSLGLRIRDIFLLERQKIICQGQYYLYVSDYPFEVEVDGQFQHVREFHFDGKFLNVFAGKIPPASFTYIDGKFVQDGASWSISPNTGIRKFWDRVKRKNKLLFYIGEIKVADSCYSMRPVEIRIGNYKISKQANSNGFASVKEKWIELSEITQENEFSLTIVVNEEVVIERNYLKEILYVYGLRSGERIIERADMKALWDDNRILIFSKENISANILIEDIEQCGDYHVYLGRFDTNKDSFILNEKSYYIVVPSSPFISINSDFSINSEMICVESGTNPSISVSNIKSDEKILVEILHDGIPVLCRKDDITDINDISLLSFFPSDIDPVGLWTISLYVSQKKCDEKRLAILARMHGRTQLPIYLEGENTDVEIVANSSCFEQDDMHTSTIVLPAQRATLAMTGNLVHAEIIELDVYNAKCELYQTVKVVPNVWGIRYLDYKTQIWSSKNSNRLMYEDLSKSGIFICTTRALSMNLKLNDYLSRRELSPGFNKLGLRNEISQWRAVNMIVISDFYNNIVTTKVIRYPCLEVVDRISFPDSYCLKLKYIGPIETLVKTTAYIDGIKVSTVSKTAYNNKFLISLYIDNPSRYQGKSINIEYKYDDQDPGELPSECLNWHPYKNAVMTTVERESENQGACFNIKLLFSILHSPHRELVQDKQFPTLYELIDIGGAK